MRPIWLWLLLALSACNRDVENARLVGTVTDRRTRQPVKGAVLHLETAYYRGGDYDSYNGYRYDTLTTDAQGRFAATFPLLCYLAIEVKQGPRDTLVYAEEVVSKNIRVDIRL
ncbi:hypothetical protein [Hymenobacter arizonensis]|uniref:Carboxypeptidase regulatory-like domain-containing protein n=1 Tax=Hymenobacter arizonensis TaxID=1227077 RepID=A0A1I6BQP0_HYMAR|nr:hypothetical protein [Hymenobacter arizonensis]SFQ83229.1 hypothetical protein SAMN04515668_4930 [Hymenobacter arizonensis]